MSNIMGSFFSIFLFSKKIELQLICNFVLVSGIKQSDSVFYIYIYMYIYIYKRYVLVQSHTHTHIYILFQILLHDRL